MTGLPRLVLELAAVGAVIALLLAGATRVLWSSLVRHARRWAVEGRAGRLFALATLPGLGAVVGIAAVMAPSVLASLGLAADHCAGHGEEHAHLCWQHLPEGAATPLIAGLAVVASLGALLVVHDLVKGVRAMEGLRRELSWLSESDGDISWLSTERPFAAAVGVIFPRIFVSRGLQHSLEASELEAAIAHERAHADGRHGALLAVTSAFSGSHHPRVRFDLVPLVELALERMADEAAARRVGDRLVVASAIVKALRARRVGALALGATDTELRVRALVAPQPTPADARWPLCCLGIVGWMSLELHHGAETLLSLLR